jgi:hypothetical protein
MEKYRNTGSLLDKNKIRKFFVLTEEERKNPQLSLQQKYLYNIRIK